ncbi:MULTISPECIES: hypothetical protein [Brevundimonas]|jgi:hypothetical protein|uniref:Uncharacterized protein n=2 Tax=Brevundimonas TaxID=41275 RepID=A0ABU4KME0_BREVE|nr:MULTISPECIES: hypothetical protein [Brevundimonas]KIC59779.1 hypothetical protein RM53_05120 [Brevundimonas nasdae]KJV39588.1 hypothetical protein VH88_12890 [Brevundimonas sp. KM4]MDX2334114.1 hypothetical protein [Brevundimonas vesicularis]
MKIEFVKPTFTPEELTPKRLAIMMDVFRRADAEAMKTRNEISLTKNRLHELENHLTKMEQDSFDAALFMEAYFLAKGPPT